MPAIAIGSPGWTPERIETLRRLYLDGQSPAQIARQLGWVTRNAVIGKAHRLGLPRSPETVAIKARMAARRRVRRRRRQGIDPHPSQFAFQFGDPERYNTEARPPFVDRSEKVPAPPSLRMRLLVVEKDGHLHANEAFNWRVCRWPTERCSERDEWLFCGHRAEPGAPYCRAHLVASKDPLPLRPIVIPASTAAVSSANIPQQPALTYERILNGAV